MGNRRKKGKRSSEKGTILAVPREALLVGVCVALVLVIAQRYGHTALAWYESYRITSLDKSLATLEADGRLTPLALDRADRLLQSWQRGEQVREEDLDWMSSVAFSMPVASGVHGEALLHLRAAHSTAVIGALSLGEDDLAISLATNLAHVSRYVKGDEERISVYKDVVRRWSVPEESRLSLDVLPALEVVLEAAKYWDHAQLVSSIYLEKAASFRWPSRDLERAIEANEECVAWMNAHGHRNATCSHGLMLDYQYADRLDASMELYEDRYWNHLQEFRSIQNGQACTPKLHLVSLDKVTAKEREAIPGVTVHRAVSSLEALIGQLPPLNCSTQSWPYFLHNEAMTLPSKNFDVFRSNVFEEGGRTWSVGLWHDHRFDEMRCLTHEDKTPVLLEFDDVFIHGSDRTISSATNCVVYHVGFPFSGPAASPKRQTLSLPVENIHQAGMISILQANYFHFLIDETQQIVLGPHFDAWPSDGMRYIIGADMLAAVVLPNVDITVDQLIPFFAKEKVYHVKKLFITDWEFASHAGGTRHTEEYFMPAQEELRLLRSALMKDVPLPPAEVKTVLFVNRNPAVTKQRFVQDSGAIMAELQEVAGRHGAVLEVHDPSQPLSTQIQRFNAASVVLGPHGAGLANILFCEPGTAVIEFPIFPTKPSAYAMMSAALQLEYWTLPGADSYFWSSYQLTADDKARLRATLDYLLSK